MPKLQQGVKIWSAKIDSPLQDWLMPWSELIGKKNMKSLFETLKPHLTPLFSDKKKFKTQALPAFQPWIQVLEKSEIIAFANRYIYPKLTSLVSKLQVDPANQSLEPLNLLFAWANLIKPETYSHA